MKRTVIRLNDLGVTKLADDKLLAKQICEDEIMPKLELEGDVVIDFRGVETLTQSFLHTLLYKCFVEFGEIAYQHLSFRNVADGIKEMVSIFYQYC